jgi:sugar/nucleoside kinase (ribokinase family)
MSAVTPETPAGDPARDRGFAVADANLATGTIDALATHAGGRPRVLLMTSRAKASRLVRGLRGAAALVGSREEGAVLAGQPSDADWRTIGRAILAMGVAQVVLTDGAQGVAVVTPTGDV